MGYLVKGWCCRNGVALVVATQKWLSDMRDGSVKSKNRKEWGSECGVVMEQKIKINQILAISHASFARTLN